MDGVSKSKMSLVHQIGTIYSIQILRLRKKIRFREFDANCFSILKASFSAEHRVGELFKRSRRGNLAQNLGLERSARKRENRGAPAKKEPLEGSCRRVS